MKALLLIPIILLMSVAFSESDPPTIIAHRHIEGGEYNNTIFINSHIEGATIRNSQIYSSGVYVSRIYDSYANDSYFWSNYMNNTAVDTSEFEGGEIWWSSIDRSYIGWGTDIRNGHVSNSTFENAKMAGPVVRRSTVINSTELSSGGDFRDVSIQNSEIHFSGIENAIVNNSELGSFHLINAHIQNSRLQSGEVSHFSMTGSWLNFIRLNDGETSGTEYHNVVACSVWDHDTQTFHPPCQENGPFTVINPS